MNAIQDAIGLRTARIAVLQDEIKALQTAEPLLAGQTLGAAALRTVTLFQHAPPPTKRAGKKYAKKMFAKMKAVTAAPEPPRDNSRTGGRPGDGFHAAKIKPAQIVADVPSGSVVVPGDKPTTIAGALKQILRGEPVGAQFTGALLRSNLEADPDWKKLLATESGEKSLTNATFNWSNGGKLKKAGSGDDAIYTILPAGKEFFQ